MLWQDETLSLGVEQFITLMIRLAFGRDNPRCASRRHSPSSARERRRSRCCCGGAFLRV